MDIFISELKKQGFQGDIQKDEPTLSSHSKDASLFKVMPQLVVFPKNSRDVERLVTAADQAKSSGENISLTARSAGTDMTGGPLSESIVVDFVKYFNHIQGVTGETATTEPGVFYRDFDKTTLAKGLILPSYPASRELCTVGGMVSNNSGGEKNLLYGKTENYILELKMVLSDGKEYTFNSLTLEQLEQKKNQTDFEGEIYRSISALINDNYELLKNAKPKVSKNSAGYYLWNVLDKEKSVFDITKLLVGSQGTLGLVTQIKFRLVKPHTHSRLLVVFLKNLKGLGGITNHLLQFKPESLESYDDHTFKLAIKLLPALLKRMKGNIFKLFWQFLPEFWAILTGGMPKLVIMAEFTADNDATALELALKAQKSLAEFKLKTRVTSSPEEVQKYWTIRRESFNMLRQHVKNLRTAPFIDDFVVRPEYLPDFLPELYALLDKYPITYTIAGHVGDGNFHIIPLMDMKDPHSKEIIAELGKSVYNLIFKYKGSITGEHNDGIVRTPYLAGMYGPDIVALFEKTKKIFDPENIFNPGKKVGGTWEYAEKHLDTGI